MEKEQDCSFKKTTSFCLTIIVTVSSFWSQKRQKEKKEKAESLFCSPHCCGDSTGILIHLLHLLSEDVFLHWFTLRRICGGIYSHQYNIHIAIYNQIIMDLFFLLRFNKTLYRLGTMFNAGPFKTMYKITITLIMTPLRFGVR